jgi:DNA-binding transcriptional LysR family regulator
MMREELGDLAAFAIVAEERSFTRAAVRLGLSTSALSQAMRVLERKLGIQLLARTTRSVAPTREGATLLDELRPALDQIELALAEAGKLRDRPAGRVRLVMPRLAATMMLIPRLAQFARKYPDVVLDIVTDDSPRDLVAGQFDAGIHIGEFIEQDMIAVRISRDQRPAIVGSPRYFKLHRKPETPRDLKDHPCIGFRLGSTGIYRWEFEKGREKLTVNVKGPVVLDDSNMVVQAALDGVGLAFAFEDHVAPLLARRRLVRVLEDWCPPFPGFFLYFPSRRNQPATLTALIEALRQSPAI